MARPKKRIIVIDAQEDRRAVTRFVLETMGYFVLSAASVWQAGEIGSAEACAGHANTLLLAYSPVSQDFLRDVAGTLAFPWLFIAPDEKTGRCWPKMADVLERVNMAIKLRRWGRRRPIPPRTVQPALAEACA